MNFDIDNNEFGIDNNNFDADLSDNFAVDLSFGDGIDRTPIEPLHGEFEFEQKAQSDMFDLVKKKRNQEALVTKQTDGEYYCVLTFQSKTQRDKFLDALKIKHLLWDAYFINGLKASEILGIEQDRIELSKARFKKNFTNEYI